ncbi:unnamed protein product, partial [Lampetra planeri]
VEDGEDILHTPESVAGQPTTAGPYTVAEETVIGEGRDCDDDDTASERSYSEVVAERVYAPQDILRYLRANFRQWHQQPELAFPDLEGFKKAARIILQKPKLHGFSSGEAHRLRALRTKLGKQSSLFQEQTPVTPQEEGNEENQ